MKEQIQLIFISIIGIAAFGLFVNFIISIGGLANVPGPHNPGMTWTKWALLYGSVWVGLFIIWYFNIKDYLKENNND